MRIANIIGAANLPKIIGDIQKIPVDDPHLDISNIALSAFYPEEIAQIFKHIPAHVRSLNLSGNNLNILGMEKLTTAFSGFSQNLESIDLTDNGLENYTFAQKLKIFEPCPLNIKYIALEKNKNFNKDRRKHYWPKAYERYSKLVGCDAIEKAQYLLANYTPNPLVLLFTFHWNRHHTDAVAAIVGNLFTRKIQTPDQLIQALNVIKIENETGSLARRKSFIQFRLFKEYKQKTENLSGSSPLSIQAG